MNSGTLRVAFVSVFGFFFLLVGAHTIFSTQTEQEKPPVFRSEVIFVDVDAVVADDEGEFIADLSQEDFVLLEDGEIQEIASFRLVNLPSGFAVVRQNDLDDGMRRIVEANSRYYLLGYHPSRTERDGRFRRIEVRVKRRGSRVEARKGYVASPEETVTPSVVSPELVRLVASPVPEDGIRLRAVAAPIDLA